MSDAEAIASLKKGRTDWHPGHPDVLAEKWKRLERTLGFLEEGLRNHFAFEEEHLTPLLGQVFMRALVLDHEEIRTEIQAVKTAIAGMEIAGLSREELLQKESQIRGLVDRLRSQIEVHATREDIILAMLERALRQE